MAQGLSPCLRLARATVEPSTTRLEIQMSHTSPPRPGDPPIPAFRFVAKPDPRNYDSTAGCFGCAFKSFTVTKIRCSRIPCHVGVNRGMVAELVKA